ncbi:hypothetical protein FQN54_003838 [Arachnomyces sp. PD_36]|nr:hypothetical protein FQN54_003838 [Arachnomyces sp. PD_36]
MSAEQHQLDDKNVTAVPDVSSESTTNHNGNPLAAQMTREEHQVATAAARFGYGPLAQVTGGEPRLPAFGGEFQPGLYRPVENRKFANPAPLGLSAFALTTFVLSLINLSTQGISHPNIVMSLAFGYGGLVQLCAGMWEMAVGNTFGATALSSYGGFWLAFGLVLLPGTQIEEKLGTHDFHISMGFFLMGWFIFTTVLLICTLKSTVAFFSLFFTLDLAFLFLGAGYLASSSIEPYAPFNPLIKTGGVFGLLAAFLAWYNALAGIADDSNSFFIVPVAHFPWSAKGRALAGKSEKATV